MAGVGFEPTRLLYEVVDQSTPYLPDPHLNSSYKHSSLLPVKLRCNFVIITPNGNRRNIYK